MFWELDSLKQLAKFILKPSGSLEPLCSPGFLELSGPETDFGQNTNPLQVSSH